MPDYIESLWKNCFPGKILSDDKINEVTQQEKSARAFAIEIVSKYTINNITMKQE